MNAMEHRASTRDEQLTSFWASIYLEVALPDASVEFDYTGPTHHFTIEHRGLNYDVRVSQKMLDAMQPEDLIDALDLVVDRIRAGAGPLEITISSDFVEHAEAA
jgi:hypothetical protein